MPPRREELYAEIAARNRRAHRADRREQRWFWARVLAMCLLWAAIGLVLGAWAFHVRDPDIGHILLTGGQLVTWVGVLGTVWWALRKSDERGWR